MHVCYIKYSNDSIIMTADLTERTFLSGGRGGARAQEAPPLRTRLAKHHIVADQSCVKRAH